MLKFDIAGQSQVPAVFLCTLDEDSTSTLLCSSPLTIVLRLRISRNYFKKGKIMSSSYSRMMENAYIKIIFVVGVTSEFSGTLLLK
jgi:hypothetical protein